MIPGAMQKSLPDLRKKFICLIILAALFAWALVLPAQEGISADEIRWYRSNASGMALEPIPSRLAAMRNEYCLSVASVPGRKLPELLLPYYDASYQIELRILYEKGAELRRQWIFRDGRNTGRLVASGSAGLFARGLSGPAAEPTGEKKSGEKKKTGIIEILDSEGLVVREFRFEEDLSQWEYRFSYGKNTLLKTETLFKEPAGADSSFVPVSTDSYRYSRSGSLRAIERIVHEGTVLSRLPIPRIGPNAVSSGGEPSTQGIAYSSEFLLDVFRPEGANVSYSVDNRGRILSEVWKDEDGEVLGEYRNTWSGDRLQSVQWKSQGQERIVEYEYDNDGNRIEERNYRQGLLERSVTSKDGRETENIYMNGKLILRAIWEKGLKISEERISNRANSNRESPKGASPLGEHPR